MRMLALLFVVLSLAATALDYVAAGGVSEFKFRPLGAIWNEIHSESLQLAQAGLQRHVSPELWTDAVFPVLLTPAAPMFAGLAFVFFLLAAIFSRPSSA